jgi:hypothetical protein
VSSLTKIIKEDVDKNLVPQRLYLMKYNLTEKVRNELISDDFFGDEIDSWIGAIESNLSFLTVSHKGKITELTSGKEFVFSLTLLRSGAEAIFEKRKGLITSLPSYHFLKPSGDHCDKFIRASNLFVSGIEVAFLAIGLLPYLKSNLKRIYVDTSSISFLVSIAIQLSNIFSNKVPVIESFESYSVLNKPYSFHDDEDSLVVISATTSGGLARKLTQQYTFKRSNIVTLFFSKIKVEQNAIFDISGAVGNITSVKPADCKLCDGGSKLIKIEGEQFIPETPKHELLTIKKVDFKDDRQKFFKAFATKELLQFNTAPSDDWEPEHFFIDVKALLSLEEKTFKNALTKKVNKHFSKNIHKVICLDDDASLVLSNAIVKIANAPSDFIVQYSDINEDDLKGHSSVMVVASAITSGRKLLATARKLRGIDSSATITYLVGFSKLPSLDALEQLRKDLCLGGHELVSLKICCMPRHSEKALTSWDIERNKLSELSNKEDPFAENKANLPNLLQERLAELNQFTDQNNLFLKSPSGLPLLLRGTFAFWLGLGLDTKNASQADVYWTIQAIIHDLRVSNDKGLATTYHSTLLSPVCFDRFNDGVIQACLLRAAKPTELNYAVDEGFSRQITDIIISVITNHNNPQGEGCLEFLFAIWSGRLKVQDKHLQEIVDLKNTVSSEEVKFMLERI